MGRGGPSPPPPRGVTLVRAPVPVPAPPVRVPVSDPAVLPPPHEQAPAGADASPPSPFDRVRAWAVLLILVAVPLAVEGLRAAAFREVPQERWDVVSSLAFHLGVGGLLVLYLRRQGLSPGRLAGRAPREWGAWARVGVVVPLLAFSLGTAVLQLTLLEAVAPGWTARLGEAGGDAAAAAGTGAVLAAALTGVLAAGLEELLFRGVLLGRWARRWGARRAVLLTSLAFAVLHLDLVGAFVFGAAMAVLYLRTRSLWVPFACHAANNLAIALSDLGGGGAATPDAVPSASLADWAGALLLVALSLPVLAWFFRATWPRTWRLPYDDDPPGA